MQLRDYYSMLYYAAVRERDMRNCTGPDSLEEQGLLIRNMSVQRNLLHELQLKFEFNYSKIREGAYVLLINQKTGASVPAVLHKIEKNDLVLRGRNTYSFAQVDNNEMYSIRDEVFIPTMGVFHALSNIAKHDYSQRYIDVLLLNRDIENGLAVVDESAAFNRLAEMNIRLDASQQAFFAKSLLMPELLAVQGPPGTGKTRLMAAMAVYHAMQGRRVFVTTQNNVVLHHALNQIVDFNPGTAVYKISGASHHAGLHKLVSVVDTGRIIDIMKQGPCIAGLTMHALLTHFSYPHLAPSPDIVLVDEAGQIPLYMAAGIASVRAGSVVFFGDDKQMPPIVPDELKPNVLSKSVLWHFRTRLANYYLSLETTYRMNSSLTHAVAAGMYEKNGKAFLQPHTNNAGNSFEFDTDTIPYPYSEILHPQHSFVWVKTPLNYSKQMNNSEAVYCADLATFLIESGMNCDNFCIVSPFKRQSNLIRTMIASRTSQAVLVDTVERIQGQSVELVIVSYTASDPDYLATVSSFLLCRQRLNVAISRARTKVIMLCSDAVFEIFPATATALSDQVFLQKKCDMAHVVDLSKTSIV